MLSLITELARCGVLLIEARNRKWWVACEIMLPGDKIGGIVKITDETLYPALQKLLIVAKKEKQKLLSETIVSNKQGQFSYGSDSGWEEIV